MLTVPKIYNRRSNKAIEIGVLQPFRRRRLRLRRYAADKDIKMSLEFNFEEYTKSVTEYFTLNDVSWNIVRDLIQEINTIFTETYETSDDSDSSEKSNVSDIDEMFNNLRVLTEKENYGNIMLNVDEKKALVAVTNCILRSEYYSGSIHRRIIKKLENVTPVLSASNFLN